MAVDQERLTEIKANIKMVQQELATLVAQSDEELSHTEITCSGCKAVMEIKDLTYIQTHWYVTPRGCSEGDYWKESEGQFDCLGCNSRLRLYQHPEIEALKRLFANVINEHKN